LLPPSIDLALHSAATLATLKQSAEESALLECDSRGCKSMANDPNFSRRARNQRTTGIERHFLEDQAIAAGVREEKR
jgi:hypothetical protein